MTGINGSETLKNDIFGDGPRVLDLHGKIAYMLGQFSPKTASSEVLSALSRIGSMSDTLASIAGETRAGIVGLYAETVAAKHISDYESSVAVMQSRHADHIGNVLTGNILTAHQIDRSIRPANDSDYPQAA